MVTIQPCRYSKSSNWGMAVISLDFAAVLTWPRVRAGPVLDTGVFCVAQALTRAGPVLRYGVHGPLVPHPVVGPSGRLAVNGHHSSGQQLSAGLGPGYEAVLELRRVQTGKDIAEKPAPAKAGVSCDGMPPGSSRKV